MVAAETKQALDYLLDSLMYQVTGDEIFDEIVYWTSFYFEIIAAVGAFLVIVCNKPVRKRLRTQDRLIFWECVLVICENCLQLSMVPLSYVEDWRGDVGFFIAWTLNEVLYLLIVLQWLVCVDYSLYHSKDHLRMHYRKAATPIVFVAIMEVIHNAVYFYGIYGDEKALEWTIIGQRVLYLLKLAIEAGYIVTAIYLVKRHSKERKEPRFIRVGAFIIPFLFGVLFRFYDASFAGIGVILTYAPMRRRDKLIDFGTGLYKKEYLDHVCKFWDKKGYKGGSALLINARGNGASMAQILSNIDIPDCFIIQMGDERFLMITGFLRDSAFTMAEQMIKEAAMEEEPAFEPKILKLRRSEEQTMTEFAVKIKQAADA